MIMDLKVKILSYVLEDDTEMLEMIERLMKAANINEYELFTKPEDMLMHIQSDIVLAAIDHYLDGKFSGLDILKEIKRRNPNSYVIIMTGQQNCKVVIEYLNSGANKYVDKNEKDYLSKLIEYMMEGLQEVGKRIDFINFLETHMKKRNVSI